MNCVKNLKSEAPVCGGSKEGRKKESDIRVIRSSLKQFVSAEYVSVFANVCFVQRIFTCDLTLLSWLNNVSNKLVNKTFYSSLNTIFVLNISRNTLPIYFCKIRQDHTRNCSI